VAKASNLKVNTPANHLLNSNYARVWVEWGGAFSQKSAEINEIAWRFDKECQD
jgi:hypothetical protein